MGKKYLETVDRLINECQSVSDLKALYEYQAAGGYGPRIKDSVARRYKELKGSYSSRDDETAAEPTVEDDSTVAVKTEEVE